MQYTKMIVASKMTAASRRLRPHFCLQHDPPATWRNEWPVKGQLQQLVSKHAQLQTVAFSQLGQDCW